MPEIQIIYQGRIYHIETYSDKDHIHNKIADSGTFYEISVLEWIRSRGKTGMYVDVGANIGNHSVWFLNECRSNAVTAIDGNTSVVPILRRNLHNNATPGKQVTVIESFVSSSPIVKFQPWGEDNIGKASVTSSEASDCSDLVPTRPLDALLEKAPPIGFLKIDVEGHEFEVLESGEKTICTHHPDIIIECFDNVERLIKWMRSHGYIRIYWDWEGNSGFAHVGGIYAGVDRVCEFLQRVLRKRIREKWAAWLTRK